MCVLQQCLRSLKRLRGCAEGRGCGCVGTLRPGLAACFVVLCFNEMPRKKSLLNAVRPAQAHQAPAAVPWPAQDVIRRGQPRALWMWLLARGLQQVLAREPWQRSGAVALQAESCVGLSALRRPRSAVHSSVPLPGTCWKPSEHTGASSRFKAQQDRADHCESVSRSCGRHDVCWFWTDRLNCFSVNCFSLHGERATGQQVLGGVTALWTWSFYVK